MTLHDFVAESNRIEGIHRAPTDLEIASHQGFLDLREVAVADLEGFVEAVASAELRRKPMMNVRVGGHIPPYGGPHVEAELEDLLVRANSGGRPYETHVWYETLHPFMDGNGRSGRVLWAWMMLREARDPFALGFLHSWYYQSLNAGRR